MNEEIWHDLGDAADLAQQPLQQVLVGRMKVALSYADGQFGVIHNTCNHAGGPLGEGRLDGDYVVCPWHQYKFHRITGEGEPGYEDDRVPRFACKVEAGRLLVKDGALTTRNKPAHEPHPLDRDTARVPGPLRVAGISTTNMDNANPRYSTSEALLEAALAHVRDGHGLETRMLKLRELEFRACEGYYSKSAHACTWPCSISQMDADDGMNIVYDSLVFWADVVLVATPIRWGAASSLYFKMAERLNTVQNQITIRNRVMLKDKVAGLIVIGGQDNIQAVAGQMLQFFGELGMQFPQFPYIAHSRGWAAEDMERNVEFVMHSESLLDVERHLGRPLPRPRRAPADQRRAGLRPGRAQSVGARTAARTQGLIRLNHQGSGGGCMVQVQARSFPGEAQDENFRDGCRCPRLHTRRSGIEQPRPCRASRRGMRGGRCGDVRQSRSHPLPGACHRLFVDGRGDCLRGAGDPACVRGRRVEQSDGI